MEHKNPNRRQFLKNTGFIASSTVMLNLFSAWSVDGEPAKTKKYQAPFNSLPDISGSNSIKNMRLTTMNGKPFAAVIDIFPQLCLTRYNVRIVEKNIALLADLGIKRLYLVVCPPGYPSFSNPWLSLLPPDNECNNYVRQGDDIRNEFINAVAEDPNVSGILLYEAFHSGKEGIEPNLGLIKMEADKISYYEPAIKALRSVSKLTKFP